MTSFTGRLVGVAVVSTYPLSFRRFIGGGGGENEYCRLNNKSNAIYLSPTKEEVAKLII